MSEAESSTKRIIEALIEATFKRAPSATENAGWYIMLGLGALAAQAGRVADALNNQRLGQDHVPTVREEADMPLTTTKTPSNTAFSVMKTLERTKVGK